VMYGCTTTMVVSNQTFSSAAVALAQGNKCALIDGAELSRLAEGYTHDHVNVLNDRHCELAERPSRFERFSRIARASVVLARDEARDLNSEEIRPEHLLLGVLQGAGRVLAGVLICHGLTADVIRGRLASDWSRGDETFDDNAEALRSIGIDLRAVRDNVDRTFGAGTYDNALRKSGRRRRRRGQIPFTKSAKKVLELSLREALAHKDSTIGCEHILLGILRGGDKYTVGLINEHVETSQLRAAIADLLDAAA
jgi:ATP-dependent Clp protease ATP-binding subunit ClpA